MSETLKGNKKTTTASSQINAINFLIENTIKGLVNTAIPVRVESVNLNGYVSATPLITQYDGFGNIIRPTVIPRLPYTRIQGGKAALIIDPEVGDMGIAVFAQQDISNLSQKPSKPASFRSYSMADGIYIGGILNQKPEIYLELTQDNQAILKAPKSVLIDSPEITLKASQKCTIDSPRTYLTGAVLTGTEGLGNTNIIMNGNVQINGSLNSTADIVAVGISLDTHTHGEVQSGNNNTGKPQ